MLVATAMMVAVSPVLGQEDLGERAENICNELQNYVGKSDEAGEKWIRKRFCDVLTQPTVRLGQLDTLEATIALLQDAKIRPSAGFLAYLNSFEFLINEPDSALWWDYHDMIAGMHAKRSWRRDLSEFLQASPGLISDQIIADGRAAQWRIEDAALGMDCDTLPIVHFTRGTLVGVAKGDTVRIEETMGYWVPGSDRFVADGGVVTWRGTSFDPDRNFTELPPFEVKLTGSNFYIDSAKLHTELFPAPLAGKLIVKLQNVRDSSDRSYPRFESYDRNLRLENIEPDVNFEGGIVIKGSQIAGTGTPDSPARLTIFREDTLFVESSALEFLFTTGGIYCPETSFSMYFAEDTLSHPMIRFRFDKRSQRFSFMRPEEGLGQQGFRDSFHNVSIDVEGVFWEQGSTRVRLGALLTSSISTAVITSDDFFKKEAFDMMTGIDNLHPLVELNRFIKQTGAQNFLASDYAQFIRLNETQTRILLLNLANEGYLTVDTEDWFCQTQPKAIAHLRNNSGRADYDVLRFVSNTKGVSNAELSLLTNRLEILGVDRVQLSDSQNVVIYPREGKIALKEGRDFAFDGRIQAGNFTFKGEKFDFNYDAFAIQLNEVDQVSIQVDDLDERDSYGNPVKRSVQSKLEQVSGTLYVDHPNNRSGWRSEDYPEFPIFNSDETSFVYYDDARIHSGAYRRDDFYYAVEPFEFKGLDSFREDELTFNGTLVSAGILPDITEPLTLMEDRSLGVTTDTPPGGDPLYGGMAKFTSGVTLNLGGLQGGGEIDFLTAHVSGDAFVFLPDSAIGKTTSVRNSENAAANVPDLVGGVTDMTFVPGRRSLSIATRRDSMTLFQGESRFAGSCQLTDAGMNGNGELDLKGAKLKGEDLDLLQRQVSADTAAFEIRGMRSGLLAFATDNVRANIDFDKRYGDFETNGGETKIDLPENQYYCYMDAFRWFMDESEVELSTSRKADDDIVIDTSEDKELSNFISYHPNQDSLHFLSPKARYNVETSVIECNNIKEIAVADARIRPDSGQVIVRKRAKMDPLAKAVVIANDVTQYHRIFDANLQINGRLSYDGSGTILYKDLNDAEFPILLSAIEVDSAYNTIARGELTANDAFMLSPAFQFAGDVHLLASREELAFKGAARLAHACPDLASEWIRFESTIDPDEVLIPVDAAPVNERDKSLVSGIVLSGESPFTGYPAFLTARQDDEDRPIILATGELRFDRKDQRYLISDADKWRQENLPGSLIELKRDDCAVRAVGPTTMPYDFGMIGTNLVGESWVADDGKLHWKGSISIDFLFDDELLEKMASAMPTWQRAQPLNIFETNYEYALREWVGLEKTDKFISDLSLSGTFRKLPKELQHTMFLTGVELVWDPYEEMFVSEGMLGVVSLGENQVYQQIQGKMEWVRSRSGDMMRFYMHGDDMNYYFFDYKLGMMNVTTRDQTFIDMLAEIKPDKRRVKGEERGERFAYQIMMSRRKRDDLVDNYREFD
jgi:hypothetical protein